MKKKILLVLFFVFVLVFSYSCKKLNPEEEYPKAKERLEALKKSSMNTKEEVDNVISEAEVICKEFINQFPEYEKTQEFRFELVEIYMFTQKYDEGLAMMDEIIKYSKEGEDVKEQLVAQKISLKSDKLKNNYSESLEKELISDIEQFNKTYPESKFKEYLEGLKRGLALRIGEPIIEYTAKDTEGKDFSFNEYKGKVLLLDFWASWCGPCVGEMPNVIGVYEKYHSQGFEIVGVSLDSKLESMNKFIAENKMPWRQIADGKGWDAAFAKYYNIRSIPATFLIDKKGIIRYMNLRREDLGTAVEELLKEK
ncbi:MAG: TlpA disulfide reductase family protein [bacterium]|nr:TlpA disulfide reductase family protein [bacterium]